MPCDYRRASFVAKVLLDPSEDYCDDRIEHQRLESLLKTLNHWDSEFSKLEDLEEWSKQQISSRVSNVDTSAVHVIFSSVDYTQDDFFTNVNVIMERVPNDITAAEYFEAAIELSRTAMNSWQLHSEQPVTLGGLRAYMKESSFAFSEIDPGLDGRVRSFQTMLKNPGAGIAWVVTCSFESSDTSALETCKTVVQTSRLSN